MRLYLIFGLITGIIFISGCAQQIDDTANREEKQAETVLTTTTTTTLPTGHGQYPSPVSSFRQDPEIPSELEMQQLPDCTGIEFSVAPVDLAKVTEISPLGNIGPPGHTFPTEHVFFHITPSGTTTETIPTYSPADVYVTLISFSNGITQDPVDYTIWFALCKDVIGYYNHVKDISDELNGIVAKNVCMFQGESKSTRCNIQAFNLVNTNSLMGQVGRLQGNFDFGVVDLNKTLQFANPSRYGTRSLHIQCPFDYYDQATRGRFFDLITRNDNQQCGITAQDVPGTLKGNWFFGDARANMGTDWEKYLAFVQDNEDPEISIVSIGGTFTDSGKWEFTPGNSGVVNREFNDVRADGKIYCYESPGKEGRILVQLISDIELKIEHQNGSCTGNFAFTSPTTYNR